MKKTCIFWKSPDSLCNYDQPLRRIKQLFMKKTSIFWKSPDSLCNYDQPLRRIKQPFMKKTSIFWKSPDSLRTPLRRNKQPYSGYFMKSTTHSLPHCARVINAANLSVLLLADNSSLKFSTSSFRWSISDCCISTCFSKSFFRLINSAICSWPSIYNEPGTYSLQCAYSRTHGLWKNTVRRGATAGTLQV